MQTTHRHPPEPGRTLEVAGGIHWLRQGLPLALDHVNLWLLADGPAWTAVDAGFDWAPAREAWQTALAGRTLARQVITHLHPDHLGLAAWLEAETGAPVWIAPAELETARLWHEAPPGHGPEDLLAHFARHGLGADRLEPLRRLGNTYHPGVPSLPRAAGGLEDGQTLEVGGAAWTVLIGRGHSPAHASLYRAEDRVLIAGDMVLPRITTHVGALAAGPGADALGLYLEALERLALLPQDTLVLPSHGLPFRGLHTRIAQLQAHHARRCGALVAACAAAPRSAADLLPVLFDRDIRDPFQTLFALGEAVAHLEHLRRTDRLARLEGDGPVRWAAVG